MEEPSLLGISSVLPSFVPDNNNDNEPDLSGISEALPKIKPAKKPVTSGKILFEPTTTDWSLDKLSNVKDDYKNLTGLDLPVVNVGQGSIHNKWGYDHRNSVDVSLNPSSKEGQQLIEQLKQANIPFLAFTKPIPGVATGPHIHIGRPSHKTSQKFAIGTTLQSPQTPVVDGEEPDLTGIAESLQQVPSNKFQAKDTSAAIEPDLDGIDQVIDPSIAFDPLKVDFKKADNAKLSPEVVAAQGWTRGNRPIIVGKNPDELGNPIIVPYTFTPSAKQTRPDLQTITDIWLNAWNPKYKKLNDIYRAASGGLNIVDLGNQGNLVNTGGNNYKIQARPDRGTQAEFEAFETAYNKSGNVNDGIAAVISTRNLERKQRNEVIADWNKQVDEIKSAQTEHPWLRDFASTNLGLQILRGGKDIRDNPAYQQEVQSTATLANNLRYLGQAIYTGTRFGYDSQQYLDLIDQERKDKEALASTEGSIIQPEGFVNKTRTGILGGAAALPRFMAAGALGGQYSLPVMVYLENLHKGNIEAARQALPMAIMVGGMHGLGEFTNAATKTISRDWINSKDLPDFEELGPKLGLEGNEKIYLDTLQPNTIKDIASDVINRETIPTDIGAGSSAPFRRVSKTDLSITKEQLTKGTNLSIKQLNPLERQLILRGSNALSLAGSSLVLNPQQKLTDLAASLTIGLSFPVGESPKEVKFPTVTTENASNPTSATQRLQLEPARVSVPVGDVNLHLTIDQAAMNYLDLENSLKTGTYKNKGDSLGQDIGKQTSIKKAMETLKQGIPDAVLSWFRENQDAVRTALKTNVEANNARSERDATQAKLELERSGYGFDELKPNIAESSPIVSGEEKASDILGKVGENNTFTSQEKAHEILQNFFKITKQGTSQSTLIPYGDVIVKKTADAAYLGAFFIEDFYHRGIEPTVDLVLNRLRNTLGEFGKYVSNDAAKDIFKKGMDYFNANDADPFFSKMKQDATEKLPNRFNVDQARNILEQYKNEKEWTVGLEDFLKENEGKKINKQDLIDVIQKGQVKVEVSVAEERNPERIKIEAQLRDAVQRRQLASSLEDREQVIAQITKEISDLNNKLNEFQTPRYSLKSYTAEKLELPGAENSKEVKLISVTPTTEPKIDSLFEQFLRDRGISIEEYENSSYGKQRNVDIAYINNGGIWKYDQNYGKNLYADPHFDEPNVVAHYRSNDRTTTDNIPISFMEEAQSQWNQEGNKVGFKPIVETRDQIPFGEVEPNPFMKDWKELVLKRFLRDSVVAKDENGNYKYNGIGWTTARQQKERYGKVLEGKDFEWSKNSDGTYTFGLNRVGDTEHTTTFGNNFTYPHELSNISLERFAELTTKEAAQEVRDQEAKNKYVLTNVPDKPYNERVFYKGPLEHDIYLDFNDFDAKTFSTEEEAKIEAAKMKERRGVDLFPVSNERLKGQFSLKEAVELRSGIGKYSDYDVAFVNMAKKLGKRFRANYSEKEIPIGIQESKLIINDSVDIDNAEKNHYTIFNANDNKLSYSNARKALEEGAFLYTHDAHPRTKKIHFLEITPAMRESLSKEGLPIYGLGKSDKLANPEIGIRNKITTQQAFDEHRNTLVQALTEQTKTTEIYKEPNWIKDEYGNEIDPVTGFDRDSWERDRNEQIEMNEFAAENPNWYKGSELDYDKATDTFINPKKDDVFNSGLSPDAFIDFLKLNWQDAKDFTEFSGELIKRFGEKVKPYLEDLWIQVKDFSKTVGSKLEELHKDEKGFWNFGSVLPQKYSQEVQDANKAYKESRRKIPYFEWYSLWRGVGLAQASPEFGQIYDVMRAGQRVRNSFESSVLDNLRKANDLVRKGGVDQSVADNIWIGNEQNVTYSDPELAAGDASLDRPAVNPDQIAAYKLLRSAIETTLDIRRETKLFSMREKANRLNDKLVAATPGSPEELALKNQLLDLGKAINQVYGHFQELKDTGYISTQRRGPIAAYAEDVNFPIGDAKRMLYNHFDSPKEAKQWLQNMQDQFGATNMRIYDIRKNEDLRQASAKLTPGQFEDLIDSAGVNPKAPEIEKLRDEIYSRYPTFGYELRRDYTRGYDRNWQFAMESIAHQTETYASSFYSRVAGELALKQLDSIDLQKKDYALYQVAKKYIDHEISAPEYSLAQKTFGNVRKGVYLFQLGFDVNQLYLNAIAQPITQTYSYFSRVEHNGLTLKGLEPEKYFVKGADLAGRMAKEFLQQKVDPSYTDANIPQEFRDIHQRLQDERVIEPEFNRSLLELETEKTVQSRLKPKTLFQQTEHWAGVFMRNGEKATRTHVAAEAYLVGKEKFNLQGEELTDFIVRAIDATQSNPTKAESPLIVRGTQNTGEVRKLLYQFNAFNHMWLENLALNVKSDFYNTYGGIKAGSGIAEFGKNLVKDLGENKAASIQRHLAPLVLMGGIKGLPLAPMAATLYTLITNKDPKKEFDKLFGKDTAIEQFALYGITTNAALSQRLTPSVPFVDQIRPQGNLTDTVKETMSTSNIPAIATAGQIANGFVDLLGGEKLRGIGELAPIKPFRTFATAVRYRGLEPISSYKGEGIKSRKGAILVPRQDITIPQQLGTSIGLQPTPLLQKYDEKRTENVKKLRRKLIKLF